MTPRIAKRYTHACSGCGGLRDREGQRYCRACHAKAQRNYRQRLLRDAKAFREASEPRALEKQHVCARCDTPIAQPSYCRECKNRIANEWRKQNPLTGEALLRARARSYAKEYLARGRLNRQPCEVCGSGKVEMHHEDYSRPLHVRWLCRPCHLRLHKEQKVSA